MRLTSEFGIGDKVTILRRDLKKAYHDCERCGGFGKFETPGGQSMRCLDCRGTGKQWEWAREHVWRVAYPELEVRLVRIEVRQEGKLRKQTEEYMCKETGVGSGSVFSTDYDRGTAVVRSDRWKEALDALNGLEEEPA